MTSFFAELHAFLSQYQYTYPRAVVLALVVVAISILRSVVSKTYSKKEPTPSIATPAKPLSPSRKTKGAICPFSKGSDFIVETAEHLPLTPLEVYEDWSDGYTDTIGTKQNVGYKNETALALKPLAARWLNMGMSGQDTPGMLRVGLRRLRNSKYFILMEDHRIEFELRMKMNAFNDPIRHSEIFVAERDSLLAQQEVLDLFVEYLPRRYPEQYIYNQALNTIHVNCIDTTFRILDWYHTKPLELCERIVQEDLVLMRPPTDNEGESSLSYRLAAAAVLFSFDALPQKLGQPVEFLHAPVPGYERHILKAMNFTMNKLKVEQPMWRNNWAISPRAELDQPLYGPCMDQGQRTMSTDAITVETIPSKFLKVEYQTIRRLPKSNYLLFTVNTMSEPLCALETVPMAASCLAASIRGMSTEMRHYKGIDNDMVCGAVLEYLDSIGSV